MKLTTKEFQDVVQYIQGSADARLKEEERFAELRAAIAEHDPKLASLMEDVTRASAEIGVYLAGRQETIH